MIVGYARISAADQTKDPQLEALSVADCEQVFQEKTSGGGGERPELVACLRSLCPGDVLVVWRLDRLARSIRDLVEILADLDRRGVGFRSLSEAIDTTSAAGALTFRVLGAVSDFERSLIRERNAAGIAAARARGRRGGRKRAMTRADVQDAKAMLSDPSVTKTEVARHFGVSRVTLNAALAREADARFETAGH